MLFPKTVGWVVSLLLAICPALAQWEQVVPSKREGHAGPVPSVPHPQLYLTAAPGRDPDNTLCLGCKATDGQKVWVQDFAAEISKKVIGESFGRKILQIELSFHVKEGSVTERMRHEWAEKDPTGLKLAFDSLPLVVWKSIVMESSTGQYNERYFIADDGVQVRPLSKARLLTVAGTRLLATDDPVDGTGANCTEACWVLQQDGPWLLDRTALDREIGRVMPEILWRLKLAAGRYLSKKPK